MYSILYYLSGVPVQLVPADPKDKKQAARFTANLDFQVCNKGNVRNSRSVQEGGRKWVNSSLHGLRKSFYKDRLICCVLFGGTRCPGPSLTAILYLLKE